MKQYVVDELRPVDHQRIETHLQASTISSQVKGVYWISLDDRILTTEQKAHTDCQPFYFALELEPRRLTCELLVRTRSRVRCTCMTYATELQRNWVISWVDDMLDRLQIRI
jgi:hypothetical protein